MLNSTILYPMQSSFNPYEWLDENSDGNRPFCYKLILPYAIIIAILSPVTVVGNSVILAAIWKKTFVKTPFHILLSGLAFTDLCTGLIAQPLVATVSLMYIVRKDHDSFTLIIDTIGVSSAIYFIEVTVLLITLMSIERWLYMSRRSLVTSHRGCLTVVTILIVPIPTVVLRVLANDKHSYDNRLRVAIIATMLTCYLTTSFAYFKVYRIIRHHQQQVQANEASQNYAQQAINLAKYKKSVTTMLFIIALLSFCFIPFVVSSGVIVSLEEMSSEIYIADSVSTILIFLSSSLNPGLYLWRMKDIRHGVKQLLCWGT
ncbi:high-affinity lysophosphatidic acid receptor-like [Orbicella faveolata]|uniref:high-affinity lysophosphatidic acid receptor-like n=1 Tax=Orbicella faveolata TaxID=48498 RepID=UPI0009E50097|nr:high-affinity lysophosphatidic acid receptor-like [Orbicella faveolata]